MQNKVLWIHINVWNWVLIFRSRKNVVIPTMDGAIKVKDVQHWDGVNIMLLVNFALFFVHKNAKKRRFEWTVKFHCFSMKLNSKKIIYFSYGPFLWVKWKNSITIGTFPVHIIFLHFSYESKRPQTMEGWWLLTAECMFVIVKVLSSWATLLHFL